MLVNIRKNIKPILGSIFIAIILWFMVATEKEYSHYITVPIEIKRLAKDKTLLQKVPESAIIELQGKGKSFIISWFYDLKFALELPNIKNSRKIELIEYINYINLPAGLQVLKVIEPAAIDLKIDELIVEKKPIFLSGSVNTEDGYILLNYNFDTDSVELAGPRTIINNISYINTESLEIKNKKSNFNQQVNIISPDPDLVHINPKSVNIDFDIQRLVERTIYEIPITVLRVPSHLNVETIPSNLSLRIKGGEKIVANVLPEEIKVEIDFAKNYNRNKEDYAAYIVTPNNISWIESIPKTFKLKVKRK